MNKSLFTLIIALCIGAASYAQLSGTYYIPTGSPSYATLQAAIADLNTLGINGNVTFIVADDYTEVAPVGGYLLGTTLLNGNSVTYTTTFQRSGTGTNPPLLSAWVGTTTNLDGIWKIVGTDNVTIDGINLTEVAGNANQTQRMEFGYALLKLNNTLPVDGCQNITIKNCTITLNKFLTATTFTTCTGIYASNHLASSTPTINLTGGSITDAMNNCKIFNNTITNVTNGIWLSGWNSGSPFGTLFDQNGEIGLGGANTITNFNTYGIRISQHRNLVVANNSLTSITLPATSITGILTQTIMNSDTYNNTVTIQPTGGNLAITGMNICAVSDVAFSGSIHDNTVQNCTNAAATSQGFIGISNNAVSGTVNMYSNTVNNNSYPGTGGFNGIDGGGATGILNLYNNTVSNNTKTGTSGTFVCMRAAADATTGTVNAYGNNIYSNSNTTTAGAAQGGTITGINFSGGNLGRLYKNQVYNLRTAGASASAIVNGITIGGGTNMNIYNNYVSDLRAPATSGTVSNWVNSIAGINVSGGTNVNVFYNTVYLNAATTGTYFTTSALYASTSPTLDLRNNILVNKSTINSFFGYVLAYRRSASVAGLPTYSINSNSNNFYVNEAEENFTCATFWPTDYLLAPITFTDYQLLVGPARDANSFIELPPFQDIVAPSPPPAPYNLHLINGATTLCESGGLQITSPIAITDDYDANTRAAVPDVGADEFNGTFTGVMNPSGVFTTVISSSQVNVAFTPNPTPNNVVIVWNTTGAFTTPSGTPPPLNSDFAGGKVLSNDQSSPANHTGLSGATTYYYKAFSYDGVSAYSTGVTVSAITNIAPPSAFTASPFSSTQINLAWTKNAFNNDVIIAYNTTGTFVQPTNGTAYPLGSTIGTGTVIYQGPLAAFSQISGLNPFTAYYYKAWSVDATNNNVYSPAGVTVNATTLCSSYGVPFTEGFESSSIGCGTVVDQNNDFSTWAAYFNAGQAHSGGNSIRVTGNNPSTDDWYFTNGLELTGGVSYTVQFWTKISSALGPQNLELKWGSSPTVAGMTSPAIYTITGYASTVYTQVTCSFTPASTGVYNIGWHCFSGPYSNSFLYVDDISVYNPLFANWTGTVNSDWANALNWLPNSIPGSASSVLIPGGITNYPTIAAPASCSNITIASGASLLDNGNLTVSGTATVNRNYSGGEWHLISSPISNATANMFLDLYLQKHTESTNAYTDISLPTTPLNVMQGYALWNDLPGTASFVGTLNTGAIGAANNVTRNGQGWNLVGNPYPSPIDWDAASGWTKTNVDNATYRHVNSAIWAMYVNGVGTNGGSRYIPSCQGFFVGVTNGFTLGTLNMTNAVRTHSTSTFFKDEVSDIVRLEVSGNGYTDETVIRFLDVATSGFDGQWDAHKLFGSVDEAPAIYSVDNDMMAINALPATNTVPVGVKAGVTGEFTITATETSEFADVILEDLLTGAITDLKNNAYSFSYDMNLDNRFIIHFAPMAVSENPADLINIYSNHKDVYVSVPANTKGDIVVYNLMGQEVVRTMINGVSNKITLDKSAYYVIKVVSNEAVVTEKVFVN